MPIEESPYENLDIGYYEFSLPDTAEFQTVRFLNKEGLAKLWNKVGDKFMRPPTGGTVGQAIVKTDTGYSWGDVATELPDVIPVEQGGTGVTSIEAMRTMLFNFPTEDQIDEYFGFE